MSFKNLLAIPFGIVATILLILVCTHTSFLASTFGMASNQHAVTVVWPSFVKVAHAADAQPTGSTVTVAPTITASYIDSQLCTHNSPACHTGQSMYALGAKYGVDPAFALAFFWHESAYGTTGIAPSHHSMSNTRCIPSLACVGGYASFQTWQQSYEEWYQLILSNTYAGGGRATVEQIIPVYAPSTENDVQAYISSVESSVAQYRSESSK